jgi:hypothetical protein
MCSKHILMHMRVSQNLKLSGTLSHCSWSSTHRIPPTPPSNSYASRTGHPAVGGFGLVRDPVGQGMFASLMQERGLFRGPVAEGRAEAMNCDGRALHAPQLHSHAPANDYGRPSKKARSSSLRALKVRPGVKPSRSSVCVQDLIGVAAIVVVALVIVALR